VRIHGKQCHMIEWGQVFPEANLAMEECDALWSQVLKLAATRQRRGERVCLETEFLRELALDVTKFYSSSKVHRRLLETAHEDKYHG
jgi:elongation factor P--beta-lysine ligase